MKQVGCPIRNAVLWLGVFFVVLGADDGANAQVGYGASHSLSGMRIPLIGPRVASISDIQMDKTNLTFRINLDVDANGVPVDMYFSKGRTPVDGWPVSRALVIHIQNAKGEPIADFNAGAPEISEVKPAIFDSKVSSYLVTLNMANVGLRNGDNVIVGVTTKWRDDFDRLLKTSVETILPVLTKIATDRATLGDYQYSGLLLSAQDKDSQVGLIHALRDFYQQKIVDSPENNGRFTMDNFDLVYDTDTNLSGRGWSRTFSGNATPPVTGVQPLAISNAVRAANDSGLSFEDLEKFYRCLHSYIQFQIDSVTSKGTFASPTPLVLTWTATNILAYENPIIAMSVVPDTTAADSFGWGIAKNFHVLEIAFENKQLQGHTILVLGDTLQIPCLAKGLEYHTPSEAKYLRKQTINDIADDRDHQNWMDGKKVKGRIKEFGHLNYRPFTKELISSGHEAREQNSPRNLSLRVFSAVATGAAAAITPVDVTAFSIGAGLFAGVGSQIFKMFWSSDSQEIARRMAFYDQLIPNEFKLAPGTSAKKIVVVPKGAFNLAGGPDFFHNVFYIYQAGGDKMQAGVTIAILQDNQTTFPPGGAPTTGPGLVPTVIPQ